MGFAIADGLKCYEAMRGRREEFRENAEEFLGRRDLPFPRGYDEREMKMGIGARKLLLKWLMDVVRLAGRDVRSECTAIMKDSEKMFVRSSEITFIKQDSIED